MTDGCGASTACGSTVSEIVFGKTVEEASHVSRKEIIEALGGFSAKNWHYAALAASTLK